jgi:HEPN domain-containing protein
VTRSEFQQVAELRVKDAEILLNAQRWDAAYYLAGYAVECALKACIAKGFNQHDIPDWKFCQNIFVHDLEKLLKLASLQSQIVKNSPLDVNWGIVSEWSEKSRYELNTTETDATEMFGAVTDLANGVLVWLKNNW